MAALREPPDVLGPGDCQCNGGQPKNFVLPCLLLLLREGPAHGYDLVERLGPFGFSSDPPVVYRNLRRLEAEGLVISSWDTSGKGPARRVYRLTARGAGNLDAWSIALRYQRDVLDSFIQRHAGAAGDRPPAGERSSNTVPAPTRESASRTE